MKDELKDMLDGVDLDVIEDADDITPDNVEEILEKYNLDKVKRMTEDVDLSDAEKMLNEAYAAVNQEKNIVNDDEDLTEEELEKLHEDIKKEVKETMKDNSPENSKKIKSKLEVEGRESNNILETNDNTEKNTSSKSESKKSKKESSNEMEDNKSTENDNTKEDSSRNDDKSNEVVEYDDVDDKSVVSKKDKAAETFKKLFYNIQDEEYEKQQRKLDRKEKRKKEAKRKEAIKAKEEKALKAEDKKKKIAEEKAAKAKEKTEQKKKQAEAKKKQLEKKKQKKAAIAKEYENEPVGRINKLGAVVVFMFIGLILFAIILGATQVGKVNDYNEIAYDYLLKGNYDQAYMTMLKLDEEERDAKLYEKLRILQKLNKKMSYYSSNMALQEREKALDALLSGVELYNTEKKYAIDMKVGEQYKDIYSNILTYLKEEFKLNEKQAKSIVAIKSKETYTEKITDICKKTRK